ncbi:hypothetical protein E1B28_006937 [Marasmius oreades]|uniref:Opi1-domain-containing protein n=1 Tax=Marasmius oreades TaxID=181124 RepID=A0A9P7S0T3_9AGAR|nr:uncharacterized protein E1B28_006937 [Marasmius oreades]KAG7093252.1 hypothetical protein E1B28_006937 [Marasmius oreades]
MQMEHRRLKRGVLQLLYLDPLPVLVTRVEHSSLLRTASFYFLNLHLFAFSLDFSSILFLPTLPFRLLVPRVNTDQHILHISILLNMCALPLLPPISALLDCIPQFRPQHSPVSPRSLETQRHHHEGADSYDGDATSSNRHEENSIPRLTYDGAAVGSWLYKTPPYNHRPPDNLRRRRSSSALSIEEHSTSSHSITPTMTMSDLHDGDYGGSSRAGTSSSVSGPFFASGTRRGRFRSPSQPERSAHSPPQERETQLTTTSRLQVFLTQASGLSVAWSAESMKRLRYCLTWLHWAIDHIDSQINFLRDFTISLQQQYLETVEEEEGHGISPTTPTQATTRRPRRRPHTRTPSTVSISEEHQRKLNDARKDVVQTIRQVVSVVSKYAGEAALPEPAKRHVKGFILMLPRRWAEAVRCGGGASASGALPPSSGSGPSEAEREIVNAAASGRAVSGRRYHGSRLRERGVSSTAASPASSRATSPSASPRIPLRGMHEAGGSGANDGSRTMSASSAMATTQKVLVLAMESLDMMKNVTGVVKKSLDAADQWVETMRRYGLQGSQTDGEIPMDDRQLPPPAQEGSQSYFSNGEHPRYHEYHDGDALSPLNLSRRGSVESFPLPPPDSPYSTHSTLTGTGSTPGTPGFTALKVPHSKLDTLSPDVPGSMGRMTLMDGDTTVKREDESEKLMKMDVDVDT